MSLPQEIDIRIPPAELAMTIDVGTVELNRLADNPAMWALPAIQARRRSTWARRRRACPAAARRRWASQLHDADWYDPAPAVGAPPMVARCRRDRAGASTPIAAVHAAASGRSAGAAVRAARRRRSAAVDPFDPPP